MRLHIPDEFRNYPLWKTIICLIGCGVILVFIIPPTLLFLLVTEKILIKKGIIKKGMNYEKVFRGI